MLSIPLSSSRVTVLYLHCAVLMYGCECLILCKTHLHKLLYLHILQFLLCVLAVFVQLYHTFECLFSLLVLLKHKSVMYYLPINSEDKVASPFI
jgi:hypothetical protein